MVPNGWKQTTLDKVLTIGGGKDYKHLEEGSIPVYGSGGYMLSVSDYLYDGESVCIGRKGTIDKPIFLKGKFWTVDTLFYTHSFKDSEPYYIYQFFQTVPWRRLNEASGVPSLSKSIINKVKINLPPLPEQRKIATILGTWDKAISTTERLIDNSKQQKKALMQQLLTGKKRLLDDSGKPFEGEWTHGYLGDLCVFKGGSAFKEVYQGNSTGEIPFIKVSDMNLPQNGKFICEANNWVTKDIAKEMKAKGFPKGAVVFAKVGAALLLNRRRILTRETIIDNNMMAATPLDSATTEFLYQIMLAIDFAKFVQDGAVPSVNQSDLSKFKLTYPKRIEQEKIASVLANADKEIELLEQQLADLKQEKKALMQQLLTGKRRVKIDDKEVA